MPGMTVMAMVLLLAMATMVINMMMPVVVHMMLVPHHHRTGGVAGSPRRWGYDENAPRLSLGGRPSPTRFNRFIGRRVR